MVASYVHLRREGLDGYIGDLNRKVWNMSEVTGKVGTEVLPVVPLVEERKGMRLKGS